MKNQSSDQWQEIEALLGEIIQSQQGALLNHGRRIIPTLTPEDMLQPNDYPELENNAEFRYEEGVLAGVQTTHMALRALRKDIEIKQNT